MPRPKSYVINGEKLCSKCRAMLPVEMFVKDSHTTSGLSGYCRDCKKEHRTIQSKLNTHQEVKAEYECAGVEQVQTTGVAVSNLSIFKFEEKQIRTVELNGEPYFVAKDVCDILGYSNTNDAVIRHCKGVVKHDAPTTSGNQEMSVIPERDVYRLVMRSKLPAAEKFENWVVSEVLPSIRKTGGYLAPQVDFTNPDVMINLLNNWKADREKLIAANKEVEEAKAIIQVQQPRIEFLESITESNQTVDMAKASKILNLGIGRNNLFALLRDKKVLNEENEPYQRYVDYGWMKQIEMPSYKPDGTPIIYFKTVLFQRGLEAIRKIIIDAYQSQEYDDLFNC